MIITAVFVRTYALRVRMRPRSEYSSRGPIPRNVIIISLEHIAATSLPKLSLLFSALDIT